MRLAFVPPLVAALVLIATPRPVAATILADWSLEEVTARADLIVVGTVGKKTPLWVGERLMTETTIAVERTLRGKPVPSIVVTQLGGKDGAHETRISGDAVLAPGDRVLLFTYAHPDGRRYLVGMALGAYALRTGPEGSRFVQRIEVPQITAEKQIVAPAGLRTITLPEVMRAIEGTRR